MKTCVSAGVKQETKRQTTTHGNPNRQRHFSYLEFLRNVSNVILRQILKMFGLDNGKLLERLKMFFAKQQRTVMKQLGAAVMFDWFHGTKATHRATKDTKVNTKIKKCSFSKSLKFPVKT